MTSQAKPATSSSETEKLREIRHEYTPSLPKLLADLKVSLIISTYQAGKVVVVGVDAEGRLSLSYHNFESAMGVAVSSETLAVGSKSQIWFLQKRTDLELQDERSNRADACYLTRTSHYTGEIQGHEMAWNGSELWIVNTLFSCLCTLHPTHSFEPRWKPPFISTLAAEDRCHLNGMAMVDGKPAYVTTLSETDVSQGWRPNKATTGCLIDVASSQTVARGFAMPHSPRVYAGRVLLLNSGHGRMEVIDVSSGRSETICAQPGYTRGLAFFDRYAFVGLSRIRETSTFGGLPIAEDLSSLKCGVGVVDLVSGRLIAHLEFVTGVEEIFAVEVLPGTRHPILSGPYPVQDGTAPIWTVPIRP